MWMTVYVCISESQEQVYAPAIGQQFLQQLATKSTFWATGHSMHSVETQHGDQPSTVSVKKKEKKEAISHMLCIHLRSLFKLEKGVKRFRNISENVEEEISKSESQSFTLVSTLASVNAWVHYLPGCLFNLNKKPVRQPCLVLLTLAVNH